MTQVGSPDEESFAASRDEVRTFLEELPKAYGIDPRRLYLLGFSQGAILASALAMMMPEAIAGVVMHSGYMAAQHAGLELDPAGLVGKPFFVAHGKYDDVIPVTWGRDAQEYLEEAGADLIYKEYPIGHTISEESLYDMSEWLTVCLDASEKLDGK
jgi:phospholipase/carboxylesterase